jgi:type IV pilus assembly protein PilM
MAYQVLFDRRAMIFKRNTNNGRDVAVGLDLGSRQIKAAILRRQEEKFFLDDYLIQPAAKRGGVEQYAAVLQGVISKLGVQERNVRVTVSCPTAMVCHAEFPYVPLKDVKAALQINSVAYLRRDFSSYCLDAFELADPAADPKAKKPTKMTVIVGGASREDVAWYKTALSTAKLQPEIMELAAVSVVNAFQFCQPDLCEKEVVLVLDIGAHSTSINFLLRGQLVMTRITQFGGDLISEYVAQVLTLQSETAEEEKLKMSETVQPLIRQSISPLVQEIRSSIDFFERQHECHVTRLFACGGSACSSRILEFLSEEIGLHIEAWNPVTTLDTSHFNGETPKLTALAPSLAAAIGAAANHLQ